jgi:hypothetical protein
MCPSGNVCCLANYLQSCSTIAACTGMALHCTGASDCPSGQVCCATLQSNGGHALCQPSCNTTTLCHYASPQDCTGGKMCNLYGPFGLSACQ